MIKTSLKMKKLNHWARLSSKKNTSMRDNGRIMSEMEGEFSSGGTGLSTKATGRTMLRTAMDV
jgi:hypothetical protein